MTTSSNLPSSRAGFNNITWLPQKVPTLFTAMSVGSAATNNITYGVNANAMVLNHNEVIEVVINNFDGGWHPIHIHGHAPQLGESRPIPVSIKLANSHSRSCKRHIYTFRGLSSIPARYAEPWAADGRYECYGFAAKGHGARGSRAKR